MWFWLCKRLSKKDIFIAKLLLFSFGAHFFTLLLLFFVYQDDSLSSLTIDMRRSLLDSNATIVFCPLQKTIKRSPKRAVAKRTRKPKIKKVQPKKAVPKKKTATTMKTVAKKKPVPKKQLPKPKPVAPKKKAVVTKKAKPSAPKKVVTKKEVKATAPVKKKEIVAKKMPAKKIEPIEAEPEQAFVADEPIYVGRDDLQLMHMHDAIRKEVEKHWKPPRGLQEGLCCHIKVAVGRTGKVVSAGIEEPSGVLLYDIPARAAALASSLPKWTWGKEFIIAFN